MTDRRPPDRSRGPRPNDNSLRMEMDQAVRAYVEAISPEQRPLFDRVLALLLEAVPDVALTISYQIPTFKLGGRRLYLAAWKHGISLYGWGADRDGGFSARHPELKSGRGTIQIGPEQARLIPDEEFLALARAVLAP